MVSLTANQESFIRRMTESEELARWGFVLLLRKPNYDEFFDALRAAGLFDPHHNPAPEPAEDEGYVRIPYWSALDYLTAVARRSGQQNDLELATKVMTIIRSVANWKDGQERPRENYHTAYKFAGILGLVPTAAVTTADLDFIPMWLDDRFERMLVARALDEGALPRFLTSSSAADLEKALQVLRHCTVIRWTAVKELGDGEQTPTLAVDDFWIKRMISNHVQAFGERTGERAAEIFLQRVQEVFGKGNRKVHSSTYRPAIEEHYQNHQWHEAENCSVAGLRDVLLSWCKHDLTTARPFIEKLLTHEHEILRRMGIYILGKQWSELRDLYRTHVGHELFRSGHLHELYTLLVEHFPDFTSEEKDDTIEALRQLPPPTWGNDPNLALKRIQCRWLFSIVGKGYSPADEWFAQLQSDPTVGRVPEHPDFDSFFETHIGMAKAAYSVAELVGFAAAGNLVAKLNAFEEQDIGEVQHLMD